MYERTLLSHWENLDPNPIGQEEYIEHKHSPIACNNEMRSFEMLRVGLLCSPPLYSQHDGIRLFYNIQSVFFPEGKGRSPSGSPTGGASKIKIYTLF